MPATCQSNLIDALQGVTDLDELHQHLVNEYTDRYSSPQFSTWLIELVNAERNRREANEVETDYPMHDFMSWPALYLIQATTLTLAIAEAAIIQGEPTRMQFCLRLQEMLVGHLTGAYLEAVCALEHATAKA